MNVGPTALQTRAAPRPEPPDLRLEEEAGGMVAGVDEAGRGPLAGPVVAAAVILRAGHIPDGVNDSKVVPEDRREMLFDLLRGVAAIGLGVGSVAEIDRLNILEASLLAMRRAVCALSWQVGRLPDAVLVDGNRPARLPCRECLIVDGDARSLSIAAASIVAKVTRDRLMAALAEAHRGYGWEHNRGYATLEHRLALTILGPSPHHRRSFSPLRSAASQQLSLSL